MWPRVHYLKNLGRGLTRLTEYVIMVGISCVNKTNFGYNSGETTKL